VLQIISNLFLSRSDIQTATALERLPFFPLNHTEIEDLFPGGLDNDEESPDSDNLRFLGESDDQIVPTFSLLRRGIIAQDQVLGPSHVRVVMVVAEHRLLEALVARGDTPQQHSLTRALLTAAHLFLYLVLRKSPSRGPVVRVLVKRLMEAIDRISSEALVQAHTYAIVWILFVGFLSELEPSEGAFQHQSRFSPRLYTVCHILGLRRKQEIEDILRMFLFKDDACMHGLNQLWDVVDSSSRLIEIEE
jgi:hypothetical protein